MGERPYSGGGDRHATAKDGREGRKKLNASRGLGFEKDWKLFPATRMAGRGSMYGFGRMRPCVGPAALPLFPLHNPCRRPPPSSWRFVNHHRHVAYSAKFMHYFLLLFGLLYPFSALYCSSTASRSLNINTSHHPDTNGQRFSIRPTILGPSVDQIHLVSTSTPSSGPLSP